LGIGWEMESDIRMIVSMVKWESNGAEPDEKLTAEIYLNVPSAWEAIHLAQKIKGEQWAVISVEMIDIVGGHLD
jgi:hypothetical protein